MVEMDIGSSNLMVSIIIPVFNAEEFLEECLDSVLGQDFSNIEMVIVDDGSTDKSAQICDEYAKVHDRVRVIHKKNEGVSIARNMGVKIAKGNLLAFVDSDDRVNCDYISKMVKAIINDDSEYVISGRTSFANNKTIGVLIVAEAIPSVETKGNKRDLLIKHFMANNKLSGVFCKLFVTEIVKANNIEFKTEIKKNEDVIFNLQYLSKVSKISILETSNYFYRQHEESITAGFEENSIERIVSVALEKSKIADELDIENMNLKEIINKWEVNEIIKVLKKCLSDMSHADYDLRKSRLLQINPGIKQIWTGEITRQKTIKGKIRFFLTLYSRLGIVRWLLLAVSHIRSLIYNGKSRK